MNAMLRGRSTTLWGRVVDHYTTKRSVASVAHLVPENISSSQEHPAKSKGMVEESDRLMFHRSIVGRLREGNKRATRKLRKEQTRIPGLLEGRSKIPDMLVEIPMEPLFADLREGRYALQKRGKTKFSGPLYELRIEPGTLDEYGNLLDTSHVPFERIRVLPHNMEIHPLTEKPESVSLRYSPENEPVRVRVPIRCLNQEKCKGLRDGGWLNQLHFYVDINVAPYAVAPLYATMDVGDMNMKDKRTVGDLQFEGKGEGCRAVLPSDVPTTMISAI